MLLLKDSPLHRNAVVITFCSPLSPLPFPLSWILCQAIQGLWSTGTCHLLVRPIPPDHGGAYWLLTPPSLFEIWWQKRESDLRVVIKTVPGHHQRMKLLITECTYKSPWHDRRAPGNHGDRVVEERTKSSFATWRCNASQRLACGASVAEEVALDQ